MRFDNIKATISMVGLLFKLSLFRGFSFCIIFFSFLDNCNNKREKNALELNNLVSNKCEIIPYIY